MRQVSQDVVHGAILFVAVMIDELWNRHAQALA